MHISGDRLIHVPRSETFQLGRSPELWRRASSEGPLYIQPRDTTPFKQGDVVDVVIDTGMLDLPWLARKVIGKKPLEAEAAITEMATDKKIHIAGGVAIVGFGLDIVLFDGKTGDNHTRSGNQTYVEYALDVEALGPLSRFSGMLGDTELILQTGADRLIKNLAVSVESRSHAA